MATAISIHLGAAERPAAGQGGFGPSRWSSGFTVVFLSLTSHLAFQPGGQPPVPVLSKESLAKPEYLVDVRSV